ncbi:MAG: hypothetical protein ABGX31_01760 [bacterium]|jgi:photosystem II stability/assembly factor-like uncharacterized protein
MFGTTRTHGIQLAFALIFSSTFFILPIEGQETTQNSVINQSDNNILKSFSWRGIGPIGQGGRVDDIAVSKDDPHVFFVGFATGGLWKTTNNGITFKPVFDTHPTASVGAIAISESDANIVWVGTGESNNRQSSSFGAGVYLSTDGGETFGSVGLEETQSISRIVTHPSDPNVAWVAASGHLFGPNVERGVYKTSNKGDSWEKVLYVDENTGATDLLIDFSNPDVLFAATYQRRRTACCFVGGGPGSGIWHSSDGGERWSRIEGNGLPNGTMGRIALANTQANPDIIYAQIEVAPDKENALSAEETAEQERLSQEDSLPDDPQYNGIWRSTDKGNTWEFRSNENGRPMYFSQIRVDPMDPDLVYTVDQRVHKSTDGGQNFETLEGYGHVDQHAFWINPENSDHVMIGNDGSLDVSYDQGENWESFRNWEVGQPYHSSVDMRRPYYVCTGLQDNGSWCGPSSVRGEQILSEDWYRVGGGDGFYTAVDQTNHQQLFSESQNGNIRRVNLETGEQSSIRPQPPRDDQDSNISPTPSQDLEIRWNWNTPFILSPHNQRVIFAGSNRLFRSLDQGETWTMSPELTKNVTKDEIEIMGQYNSLPRCRPWIRGQECILSRNDGVSQYSTIVSITESTLLPGLLWVGTDDGNIQMSRDGGSTWTEVGRNISGGTQNYYVSRVEASHTDPATAYASLDGHRSDDLRPYIYTTHDFGETWTSISSDLPQFGNVRTIREDPNNHDLLYAGTEFGFYISLNGGDTWQRFMNNLGTTRVDDVLVHPRDNDLVLATHGRSIQIIDDITPLQNLTSQILEMDIYLFQPREAVLWKQDPRFSRSVTGAKIWQGKNASAGTNISYYLKDDVNETVSITVTDLRTGETFREMEGPTMQGLNRVVWDLRGNAPPVEEGSRGGFFRGNQAPIAQPGTYRVTLKVSDNSFSQLVDVLEDVWIDER